MSEAVALTRSLVALDTAGHDESRAVAVLAPLLESAGFDVSTVEHAPGRCTLVAEWSIDHDVPPLCLSGHLDTVPLGAAPWTHDPFFAEQDGDRLHGRGTSDMKGGVAAIVAAATRLTSGRARRAGLRIVLTAAEETGSDGARAAASLLRGRPSGPLVITEPTANTVAYGHKGALWLTGRAVGVTAHGSTPSLGVNAITRLAHATVRLAHHSFRHEAHPVMGEPTLNVGTFHGGLNTNSVPDRAEMTLDVRTVAGQRHDLVSAELAACAGPDVEWEPLVDLPPVWTQPDGEWAASVASDVREITGVTQPGPRGMSYFTDAAVLAPALGSVPTVICGPGEPDQAHVTDEWCSTSRIDESVAILQQLCRSWCGL
ncbi:M20 family metallopeptidase [Streptomyces sp. NPDC002588]|uniref:M20 family metallopeptidase n=1 Tax=Streptomyces sp. NPDC002588 TaxID=3154419 RepID=UPI00332984A5